MKNCEILIKGVDFDFQYASVHTLKQIADEFGGESRFEPSDQRVTYMFNDPYVVPINDIAKVHEKFSELGRSAGKRYGCKYVGNELYLTTSQEGAIQLLEVGIDFYFRHI
ncbi:MAG: hypothetical protein EBS66_16960 [Betaproteobacteria bacterium]|nr:hypothetical protein [Betaproteobacteria bacterium]